MSTAYDLPTWAALPAIADPGLDRLARTVATRLRAPRALVVLVSKGGQVIPGAVGLPEPWATRRSMPLSHSLSQHVAATGRPLVLRDAREHAEFADSPSVRELGVVGYAAMPLWDVHGRPTGVLVASDDVPRDWTEAEVQALGELAAEGSRQLQAQAVELAEREARAAAVRDDAAARTAAQAAHAAFVEAEADADRTRLVARLSSALLTVQTLPELVRAVDRFVRSPLGATSVQVGVAEAGHPELRVWSAVAGAPAPTEPVVGLRLDDASPLAVAVRDRRLVPVDDGEEVGSPGLPAGTATVVAVPLVLGQHSALGGLLVAWGQRRELDPPVRAVVGELARHVGHGLDLVLLREQRLRLDAASPPPLPASA